MSERDAKMENGNDNRVGKRLKRERMEDDVGWKSTRRKKKREK